MGSLHHVQQIDTETNQGRDVCLESSPTCLQSQDVSAASGGAQVTTGVQRGAATLRCVILVNTVESTHVLFIKAKITNLSLRALRICTTYNSLSLDPKSRPGRDGGGWGYC